MRLGTAMTYLTHQLVLALFTPKAFSPPAKACTRSALALGGARIKNWRNPEGVVTSVPHIPSVACFARNARLEVSTPAALAAHNYAESTLSISLEPFHENRYRPHLAEATCE